MPAAPWDQTHFSFTGPGVAISCDVDYDREREAYVATSFEGFYGVSRQSAKAAALVCFRAWIDGEFGGYTPSQEADEP